MFRMLGDFVRGVGRVAVKGALAVPRRAGQKVLRAAGRYSDTAEGLRLALFGPDEEPTWQAYPPPDPVPEPVTVTPRTARVETIDEGEVKVKDSELSQMTVAALKTLARAKGLTVPRRIKKSALIEQIQSVSLDQAG